MQKKNRAGKKRRRSRREDGRNRLTDDDESVADFRPGLRRVGASRGHDMDGRMGEREGRREEKGGRRLVVFRVEARRRAQEWQEGGDGRLVEATVTTALA